MTRDGYCEVSVDGVMQWRRCVVRATARDHLTGRLIASVVVPETKDGELLIEQLGCDPIIVTERRPP